MSNHFTTGQGIMLNTYLQDGITAGVYFSIAEQIAAMLAKVQGEGLQIELDLDTMQLQNGKVQFQMAVEDSVYELERIKAFFRELTFQCVFAGGENCQRVSSFLHYLDDNIACCSLDAILDYCAASQENSGVQGAQRKGQPNMRSGTQRNDSFYGQPSAQLGKAPYDSQSGSMQQYGNRPGVQAESGQLGMGQQYGGQQSTQPGRGQYGTQAGAQYGSGQLNTRSAQQPSQPDDGETGVLGAGYWEQLENQFQPQSSQEAETGVLDPSFWEMALKSTPSTRLDNGRQSNIVYGRLINTKTGQATEITRDNFWIGKEDVDLQISKDVISRRHAVLICKENHYYISDNGSMNKTYVNNKEIPAKASVEIFDGTKIKFANEEYEFRI